MSIKINYTNKLNSKSSTNLVLFVDENFNINGLKKVISKEEFFFVSDLLKNCDLKKDLLFFKINSKKTIFLASIKKNLKTSDIESLGAKFHSYINYDKQNDYLNPNINPNLLQKKRYRLKAEKELNKDMKYFFENCDDVNYNKFT